LSGTAPLITVRAPLAFAEYDETVEAVTLCADSALETTSVPDGVNLKPKGIWPVEGDGIAGPATPPDTGKMSMSEVAFSVATRYEPSGENATSEGSTYCAALSAWVDPAIGDSEPFAAIAKPVMPPGALLPLGSDPVPDRPQRRNLFLSLGASPIRA